ncbi:MAG: transglutaminase-like domain-containing protein [Actinomycetales bacterium]
MNDATTAGADTGPQNPPADHDVSSMRRTVTAAIDARIDTPADLIFSFAAADGTPIDTETLEVTIGEEPTPYDEIRDENGTRLHVLRQAPSGPLRVRYRASIVGGSEPPELTPMQEIVYTRPSRYCDSDVLAPIARAEFGGYSGRELVDQVTSWVGTQLAYVSGSSRPIDGAVDTLLARQGVCRDYAHLVVALLRALGVPARLVSVYAPGLFPMDFHAVAEAVVDGRWQVLDATCLAPRSTMLRIATGRDAADTAFMTVNSGRVDLLSVAVTAVAEPGLPDDNPHELAVLR